MSPWAEAKAGSAAHGLLCTLDHRSDLRTIRHRGERIEGRPYALERISHGLADSPADFCQGVGELGIPVLAHTGILSPAQTQSHSQRAPAGAVCRPAGRSTNGLMTTTRLMARLADAGQGAGWTLPAKRVELVDGDDVRQPGEVVDGGKVGPG